MDIQAIRQDWKNGMTHGAIQDKHDLNAAQEFAINVCSDGLTEAEIAERIGAVKRNMGGARIRAIMQAASAQA